MYFCFMHDTVLNHSSNILMQIPAGIEWIIIIIVIVLVFFGVKKIPEIAKSVGKASSEFQMAQIKARKELDKMKSLNKDPERENLEEIADTLGIDHEGKTDDELRAAIEKEINGHKKE
jgi:sec-independent protein translocase protein TatA